MTSLKPYRVTWEIDVDASDPREAAELARHSQTRDGTEALVFSVLENVAGAVAVRVDLLEPNTGRIEPGEFSKAILAGYSVEFDPDSRRYTAHTPDDIPGGGATGRTLAEAWMADGFATEREAWASCDNHRMFGALLAPEHPLGADGYTVVPAEDLVNRWVMDHEDFGDLAGVTYAGAPEAWAAAERHHERQRHALTCAVHDGGRCDCDVEDPHYQNEA
ncbi:hypothetical protein CPT_Sansa109 [Caulobacter phage Sansa]|uniref:Uncharacterized protein n=1 Tax=Caulobacter phage Sansa TaxID=1675600 RepID=A0A0K1LMS5_9CAUD|nr:hypothetical protein HOR07_gp109 [Caulobacter phage Sansa]AKU43513.1 hypothetical protein CPT_Sansa109 [Caulobacter phage Sansa]